MAISWSSFANELAERLNPLACRMKRLLAFPSSIGLGPEVGGSGTSRREEAREDRLDDRAEDDLSAVRRRQGHPQDEDELEGVVEG